MRVAICIDQERRRHQMRHYLRLLVHNMVLGVSQQRPEIRVKEQLRGQLK